MKPLASVLGALFLLTAIATPSASRAGVNNDIPSCYVANKVAQLEPPVDQEVFLLIDQTTGLDDKLQQHVRENFGRLVRPQSAFVIATFSEFGQGRYTEILSAGTLEGPLPTKDREDIKLRLLKGLDACMADQLSFGRRLAATTLDKALAGQSSDLARSDIMSSLKELSARVKASKARDKLLFIVSDMLENSSIASFYSKHSLRLIDPSAEMKRAQAARMLGDFGGARVHVLGAGLMQDSTGKDKAGGSYRDPRAMGALREFWEAYFAASNAKVVQFGTPSLLTPVK